AVELRRGFFWYYFEPHAKPLRVELDPESPCQGLDPRRRGTCLFRVRTRGRRIACEFSHSLTDGSGGIRFLKTLLVEYFRLRGVEAGGEDPEVYRLDEAPDPEEFEDAYNRHFFGDFPHPEAGKPAFRLESPLLDKHRYRVISGVVPLAPVLAKAKEFGVSLTELLAAVYMDALQEIWFAAPPAERRRRRPLAAVEIPVNMRKFYPTRSNRNFSLFILITQDFRLGRREFPEIVARAHHQMRFENDAASIARQISRNVGGSRKLLVRLVPLVVKDFFARLLFSAMGENLVSGFISNLGPVSLPPGPAAHVERFDFIPASSRVTKTNASTLSWKGKLYIDFGSLARSRELERLFFLRLRKLGLPVHVECNLPEAELGPR
ncbi:MAG: hypothetical protein JNG85_10690, partial [Spirochaetaceae bacterium]|nr:hypothetical protein [Spirochaetaceae bacterium]